eukprot:2620449-Heterocapsa_arctica.AAC.1
MNIGTTSTMLDHVHGFELPFACLSALAGRGARGSTPLKRLLPLPLLIAALPRTCPWRAFQ